MLDIRLVRENAAQVRQRLAARGGGDEAKIDELIDLDKMRRSILTEVEALKSERNRVSKEIGALMAQKKADEAEAKKAETRKIGDTIAEMDRAVLAADKARDEVLLRIPNIPHSSVPVGKSAEDNPEVRRWGQPAQFSFKPKNHVELCESLKLVDFARGAKLSGSGFLLYTHWGAKLERALIQYLLDLHSGNRWSWAHRV